jgi:hypothetical protein
VAVGVVAPRGRWDVHGVPLRDQRDQRDQRRLLDDTSMPASVEVLHRPRFQKQTQIMQAR